MGWLDKLPLGATSETTKTFGEFDAYAYVGVVGDFNPAYVDETLAKVLDPDGRVVPWAMLGGCLGVVATQITTPITPPGTVSVGYDLSFETAIRYGDTITTRYTLLEKSEERRLLVFAVLFTNHHRQVVGTGKAYAKITNSA